MSAHDSDSSSSQAPDPAALRRIEAAVALLEAAEREFTSAIHDGRAAGLTWTDIGPVVGERGGARKPNITASYATLPPDYRFNIGQVTAVRNVFALAGYSGPLWIAPVASEEERLFLVPERAARLLRDVRRIEQAVGQILGRKVFVTRQNDPNEPRAEFE